jgi:hypothetical protein
MTMSPLTTDTDWTSLDLPKARPAMPVVGEWMTPWVASSFLVAVITATYVVGGNQLPLVERTLLAISLCATLTAATLVVIRSSRSKEESTREERARPAAEALDSGVAGLDFAAYVDGMRQWTASVLELLEHARGCAAEGSRLATELDAGLSDTSDLQQLLNASAPNQLNIHDAATIRSVCTLWETNQDRIEQLAASSDPGWHRRWRARSVADRRLRHGAMVSAPMVIPYRT